MLAKNARSLIGKEGRAIQPSRKRPSPHVCNLGPCPPGRRFRDTIDVTDPIALRAEAERRAQLRAAGYTTSGDRNPTPTPAAADDHLEKQIEAEGDRIMQRLAQVMITMSTELLMSIKHFPRTGLRRSRRSMMRESFNACRIHAPDAPMIVPW